jgi:hypothetical protein
MRSGNSRTLPTVEQVTASHQLVCQARPVPSYSLLPNDWRKKDFFVLSNNFRELPNQLEDDRYIYLDPADVKRREDDPLTKVHLDAHYSITYFESFMPLTSHKLWVMFPKRLVLI